MPGREMCPVVLERALQIHLAHRFGAAGKQARHMASLTIAALRRARGAR